MKILGQSFLFIICFSSCPVWADITGIVFSDFDGDGNLSTANSETGIPGVVVSALDSSGAVVAQTTTFEFNCTGSGLPDASCNGIGVPARGSYTLTLAAAGPFRIEFTLPGSGELDYLNAAPGSSTSVQFANDGDAVNLGLMSIGEYCQSDPDVLYSCFPRGDSAGNNTTIAGLIPYTANGRDPSLKATLAVADEGSYVPGSVWGAAYDSRTGKFYVSAARRAYSGVGSEGLGAIHEIDLNAPLPNSTLWNTIPNPGTAVQNFSNYQDADGYTNVGKVGIGDIDISEDSSKLYVMGLNDNGVLYEYEIASGTLLNSYPVNDPGCSDPTDVRPWATTTHQGEVFIGVVCSEEAPGGTDSALQAFVMKLDPAAGNFTTVANMPLDYVKDSSSANCSPPITGWFRWDSDPANFSLSSRFCNNQPPTLVQDHPSPILGDIEFDTDESMILGFIDRFSMQSPHFQPAPDPADNSGQLYSNNAGGDVKRLCFTGTSYIQEGTPGCEFNPGVTFNEYYPGDDFLFGGFPGHAEVFSGGLALLSGSGELVGSAYDAVDDPGTTGQSFGTSGLRWLSNTTGTVNQAYESVPQSNNIFSKAVTLGDVELRCQIPPLEVGNLVWEDVDGDGIQDPDEPPLAGVIVELLADTTGDGVPDTVIATALTDANGNYLFSNDPDRAVESTANFVYDLGGYGTDGFPNTADDLLGLKPSFDTNGDGDFTDPGDLLNTYAVRVPNSPGQLPTLETTVANSDGILTNQPLMDIRDSDASFDGVNALIVFNSASAGQSNQTSDFGFSEAPPPVEIGDTVFIDVNMDGIQDAGDTPVVGATVNLFDLAGNLVATTTTDANGNYLFGEADGVLPGVEYAVVMNNPADFAPGGVLEELVPTIPNVGGDDALDSDATLIGGFPTIGATAPAAGMDTTFDFGFTQLASLGDFVFEDTNANGIQDPGEQGINGVTIMLFDAAGNMITTDAFGNPLNLVTGPNPVDGSPGFYMLSNLLPGDYTVKFTPPPGFTLTPPGVGGDPALDSNADPVTGLTPTITLVGGQNDPTIDAGVIPPTVVDVVINVFDAAGLLIASEPGWVLPGQATELNLTAPPFNLSEDQYGLVEIVRTSEPSLSALAGTCFDEPQDNPLVVPWNGFLEQFNILTVQNTCPTTEAVELALFDADGVQRSSEVMEFAGNSQLDVSLNALEGYQVDQVGTVTLSYQNSGCISGNLARFKLDASGSGEYDFDLNLPLVNMSTGTTYASYNTFQPSLNPADAANPVYNWLEVINLSGSDLGFTKNIYDVAGTLVETEEVVIPSQARRDLQAGHENPGPSNVGVVELIPTDPEASYFARVMRYGSNPAVAGGFDFSSSSDATVGETGCKYASVSSGANGENWLVVSNLSDSEARVNITIATGGVSALNSPAFVTVPAKGQVHISASSSLPAGAAGVATVCSVDEQPLSVESNFYFRDAEAGNVSSAYTRRSDEGVCGDTSVASYNTFLGQANWLRLTGIGAGEIVGEVVRIEPESGLSSSSALQ